MSPTSCRKVRPGGFDYVLEARADPQMLALAVELTALKEVAGLIGGAPLGARRPSI